MTNKRSSISRRPLLALGAALLWTNPTLAGSGRLGSTKPQSSGAPAGLKKLLAQFKECPGITAQFEEEKNIALLAAPLKSKGRVFFHPPHSLARIVDKPRASHLVIKGKKIVVKEDGVRREVDLSNKPALRGLVGSLVNLLAGDVKKLLADYQTNYTESGQDGWRLELVPKDSDLRRMVNSLTFSGNGMVLSSLRVREANGDESITQFYQVDTKKEFSSSEIARYFDI